MALRIGINGFGRIGRTALRAWVTNYKDTLQVVHINDLTDSQTLAHLLKYDSVHGVFNEDVQAEENSLQVGDQKITLSSIKDPSEINWADKGVDIVFECTGIFAKAQAAKLHLKGGAKKVLVSAPSSGEDITVVYGVNHQDIKSDHVIVSNGSCTTNCLAPVAQTLNEHFGIEHGLMTTIHAYTNDQRILDLPHKDLRRARAAAMSMIPTTTGAAKAIALVVPELKDKLHGMAVRVPTANVSMVDLVVKVKKQTSIEEVNSVLKKAADNHLKGVMGFSMEPLVSIDYNGCTLSSTVDALSTSVMGGHLVKVIAWYDNETGFSNRMLDVARLMGS